MSGECHNNILAFKTRVTNLSADDYYYNCSLTSGQKRLSNFRRLHGLALPPDGDDDDGVAGGDDNGRDEEERGACAMQRIG